jgi:hypothetical protein
VGLISFDQNIESFILPTSAPSKSITNRVPSLGLRVL